MKESCFTKPRLPEILDPNGGQDGGLILRGIRDVMSNFTARDDADVLVVNFDGSSGLNDFRNNALRESLYELVASRPDPRLAVDLQQVDYLSSSGVAILVGLKRRVEAKGGKIFLYRVQPIVFDLLAVMKLDQYFSIVGEEGEAMASLRSVPTA